MVLFCYVVTKVYQFYETAKLYKEYLVIKVI